MTANMGWARALGIAASGAATKQFDFLTCGISKQGAHINEPGIRGSRSHIAEAVSEGPYIVGGPLSLIPRPDDLDDLLPWIMGSTFSSETIIIGDTLTDRDIDIDWGDIGVPRAEGCRVNSANFSSSAGGNLRLDMDIQGKTWTPASAGTFPAISATLSNLQPYVHTQSVLTINSVARPVNNVNLAINNNLILDRFQNSLTRTELPSADLNISLDLNMPFMDPHDDLWDMAVAGFAGSLVYTNGARSLTFTFANLKAPAQAIELARSSEMVHSLPLTAYRTSANPCLTVVNDLTG